MARLLDASRMYVLVMAECYRRCFYHFLSVNSDVLYVFNTCSIIALIDYTLSKLLRLPQEL
jgi:hypothetical protein